MILRDLMVLANQADAAGETALAEEITEVMISMAAPADMSAAEKKYWEEAEDIVKKEYKPGKNPDKFYGTVTNIFKAKVEKHLGHNPFKKKRKKKKKKESMAE